MVFHLLRLQLTLLYFSSLDILRANILSQIFVIMVFHLLRLQLTLLYFSSLDILRANILSQIFVIMVFHLLRLQLTLFILVPLIYYVQTFYHKFCNYGFSPSSPSIDSLYFSSLDILRANILSQIFVIMVFHLLRLQLTLLYFSSLDILRANILSQIL